jgi:hypothetical protein
MERRLHTLMGAARRGEPDRCSGRAEGHLVGVRPLLCVCRVTRIFRDCLPRLVLGSQVALEIGHEGGEVADYARRRGI